MLWITYDWKRKFIFRKKESISGKTLAPFQYVNRRTRLWAEGADAYEYTDYATDKELFEFKLRGTE